MNKVKIICILSIIIISCKENKEIKNPLLNLQQNSFNIPELHLIKAHYFMPAFQFAIEQQKSKIEKIIENPEPPDFNNTIVLFDQSGIQIRNLLNIYNSLNWVNLDSTMQSISNEISAVLTENEDNIYLNQNLFDRINHVYLNKENFFLDPEEKNVLEKYYFDFILHGANLSNNDKSKLRRINQQLSYLIVLFGNNYLAETNNNYKLIINKKEDLEGLPDNIIEASGQLAKDFNLNDSYVFTLNRSSIVPFLTFSKNRRLRQEIYSAFINRCNNNNKYDNNDIFLKIIKLRKEKAELLGFNSYAELVMSSNMKKNPLDIENLLTEIFGYALPIIEKNRLKMQKIIDEEDDPFQLSSWDWLYYANKLKQIECGLKEKDVLPYFSLESVTQGMFHVANRLYGITFTQLKDIPVYNTDINCYHVKDSNSNHLGILFTDLFSRKEKLSGAWTSNIVQSSYMDNVKIYPVVSLVCNYSKTNKDNQTLLSIEEVKILFHEFGHALHSLFADGKYIGTTGVLPADMMELPSQIMEKWAVHPDVIKIYAKHYITGESIPLDLINKLNLSYTYNQAYETVEYISAALLDLKWHTLNNSQIISTFNYEQNILKKIRMPDFISPRARSHYFYQIIAGGYEANLYDYLWSDILATNAFQAFYDSGDIFNRQIAASFRKYILVEGGNDESSLQYYRFLSKEPSIFPMLKKKGFYFNKTRLK